MNFGSTQIVRRSSAVLVPARTAVASVGRRAEVRVGRRDGGTRVGQESAQTFMPNPNEVPRGNDYSGGSSCGVGFDWAKACPRPLSVARTLIAAGETTQFSITPCGPYRLECIIVPESFAQLFEITQIKVCRTDYINDNPLPAEAFTTQGNYACSLGCGSVFYSSQPLVLGVKNVSGAAARFSAMILGRELDMCG